MRILHDLQMLVVLNKHRLETYYPSNQHYSVTLGHQSQRKPLTTTITHYLQATCITELGFHRHDAKITV